MSTLEYRRCDYLGCIASIAVEDESEWERWGVVTVEPNEVEERGEGQDLCPEHLDAVQKMLEGA